MRKNRVWEKLMQIREKVEKWILVMLKILFYESQMSMAYTTNLITSAIGVVTLAGREPELSFLWNFVISYCNHDPNSDSVWLLNEGYLSMTCAYRRRVRKVVLLRYTQGTRRLSGGVDILKSKESPRIVRHGSLLQSWAVHFKNFLNLVHVFGCIETLCLLEEALDRYCVIYTTSPDSQT